VSEALYQHHFVRRGGLQRLNDAKGKVVAPALRGGRRCCTSGTEAGRYLLQCASVALYQHPQDVRHGGRLLHVRHGGRTLPFTVCECGALSTPPRRPARRPDATFYSMRVWRSINTPKTSGTEAGSYLLQCASVAHPQTSLFGGERGALSTPPSGNLGVPPMTEWLLEMS